MKPQASCADMSKSDSKVAISSHISLREEDISQVSPALVLQELGPMTTIKSITSKAGIRQ